jgi:hypothetical protein
VAGIAGQANLSIYNGILPPVFTDKPLTAATTVIKAAHVAELRQAIADLRSRSGLSQFPHPEQVTRQARIDEVD